MRATASLGLRLAIGTRGQRARSIAVLAAAALGTVLLLLVWGIADSQVGSNTAFETDQITLLVAGTIGMVALPVLVLIATVARLSAALRDRRLANLRLLGMTSGQTRSVAAIEVGLGSLVGAGLGVLLYLSVAPLVARIDVPGQDWSTSSLIPPALGWSGVLVALPVASVLTAMLPQRLSAPRSLQRSRRSEAGGSSPWRLAPLVLGLLLCWWSRSPFEDTTSLSRTELMAILAGIALLGLGILIVVPVFVHLVAEVVLRVGRGPLATLVGRRLQSQPAGATRVISALMIGLFIVVGSRAVVAVFEATPQYRSAAQFVEQDQTAEVTATARGLDATVATLESVDGVERVSSFPTLLGRPQGSNVDGADQLTVIVAACRELAGPNGHLAGCSEDRVSLVNGPWSSGADLDSVQVQAVHEGKPRGQVVDVPIDMPSTIGSEAFDRAVGALAGVPAVVIPPDTAGITGLATRTDNVAVAHAGPGRDLYETVTAAGFRVDSLVDLENYDFVTGLRTLVWTLAMVVLSVGLLTFTVAGIDRALARRRELTGLRLVGAPPSLLRWSQWLEAALPTVFGGLLAILGGAYAGATYLQLDRGHAILPMTAALTLAAAAVVTSSLLALLTVAGTITELDPKHIRSE